MAKLTLTDIAAGYALVATYNANNDLIEAALENTLSRDGTTPNTMSAALDMNSQQITNLPVPTNAAHAASKSYVDGIVTGFTSSATFSAALPYGITGSWDFETLTDFEAGLRIYDAVGGSDFVGMIHDGTDLNVTAANTTNVNFYDGLNIRLYDATDAQYMEIYQLSSAGASIYNTSLTVGHDFRLNDVVKFQIQNAEIFTQLPLKIKEAASAPADDASYGCVWVKSDAPNNLMYTDDTGQDVQLTEDGRIKGGDIKVLASDQNIASSTTLAQATGLTTGNLDLDSWYEIKVRGMYTQNVGNFKCSLSASQAFQSQASTGHMYFIDDTGTELNLSVANILTGGQATTMTDTENVWFEVTYLIQTDATTAGTVSFYFAQETESANNTTLEAGTYLKATKLA